MTAPRSAQPFAPAWWIPGAHLRTLWGKFFRPRSTAVTTRECWETPDGDFLELHRMDAPASRPRLLILHGLEGSQRSHYAVGMLAEASRRGWAADVLVFRSCGEEMNRLPRFYHSGETADLDFVVRTIVQREQGRPLLITGVSLGGNVLLKWLGENGSELPPEVRGAATVSVPYDLAQSTRYITRGASRMYEVHFLRSLRRKARRKEEAFPGLISQEAIDRARTLYDFDDCVTAPLHGFAGADDYYARSSSIRFLHAIRRPTLMLSARDDPFMPPELLDEVAPIARANRALELEIVERGGHVGFIGGSIPFRPVYYAERRVGDFLDAQLPAGSGVNDGGAAARVAGAVMIATLLAGCSSAGQDPSPAADSPAAASVTIDRVMEAEPDTPAGELEPAGAPAVARPAGIAPDSVARRLLVDVRDVDPTIRVRARYAGSDNFTGTPLAGYRANRVLLHTDAASALARAQTRLRADGVGLKAWDGYRPVRATQAMAEWAERTGRSDLLNGWIARRSRHNLGLAIDVTLVELDSGEPLDMGTDFDTFSPAAHTANATGDVARNRQRLVNALEAEGFSNYFREWWHFDYRGPTERRFDLPID
jgi:uncharacterized protein